MADPDAGTVKAADPVADPNGTTIAMTTTDPAATASEEPSHSTTQAADTLSPAQDDTKLTTAATAEEEDTTAAAPKDEDHTTVQGVGEEEKEDVSRRTVCISNLSDSLKEDHLRGLFVTCGDIELCTIRLKFGAGRVCYIRFHSEEAAQTALLLNEQPLDGKPMAIALVDGSILDNFKITPSASTTTNGHDGGITGSAPTTSDTVTPSTLNGFTPSVPITQSNALQTVQLMANAKSVIFHSLSLNVCPRKIASKSPSKIPHKFPLQNPL